MLEETASCIEWPCLETSVLKRNQVHAQRWALSSLWPERTRASLKGDEHPICVGSGHSPHRLKGAFLSTVDLAPHPTHSSSPAKAYSASTVRPLNTWPIIWYLEHFNSLLQKSVPWGFDWQCSDSQAASKKARISPSENQLEVWHASCTTRSYAGEGRYTASTDSN